jgi:hypothetical protein
MFEEAGAIAGAFTAPKVSAGASPKPKATSRLAVEQLLNMTGGYIEPSPAQRTNLMVAFAMGGIPLFGAAYDLVRCASDIDLNDRDKVIARRAEITLIEVKSTNQAKVKEDLKGYFFNVTGAEFLVAQSLGDQYRFAFVNIVNGFVVERSLRQVFASAKAMYTAYHLKF